MSSAVVRVVDAPKGSQISSLISRKLLQVYRNLLLKVPPSCARAKKNATIEASQYGAGTFLLASNQT